MRGTDLATAVALVDTWWLEPAEAALQASRLLNSPPGELLPSSCKRFLAAHCSCTRVVNAMAWWPSIREDITQGLLGSNDVNVALQIPFDTNRGHLAVYHSMLDAIKGPT